MPGAQRNYQKNNLFMLDTILNLTSLLDGYIYTDEYKNTKFLNNNQNLKNLCMSLYNLAKNDTSVPTVFIKKLQNSLTNNNFYICITEMIFYIILEKKQPIYIETIVNETIENILNNTNISINDLQNFLTLQFKDGTNYTYSLKQLAKNNNPYACFELGMMEYNGEITGTPRYNKSYEYFKIASSFNHPRANYLIAKMLLDKKIGTLSQKDINLAWNYLQTASNLGSIAALNAIGIFYLNYKSDEKTAIEYFIKATQSDYVYAYNNLGKIYETKKDYQTAFSYYLKSANLEESWACNKVGEMYRLGIGTEKDLKKSYDYYNLSLEVPIKLINHWAKYNLAKYFYLKGNYEANIEQNIPLALNLLEQSKENNLLEANIELLYFYTDKYFQKKEEKTLTKINNLIQEIEQHPNFNLTHKQIIEKTINQIKKNLLSIKIF